MKHKVSLVVLLFVCTLLSAGNLQKVVGLSDSVYDKMDELYVSSGLALPSTTRPWNMDEVQFLLSRIDAGFLDSGNRLLYDSIASLIDDDPFCFIMTVSLSPEFYLHTNASSFSSSDDWYINYEKRAPFASMKFDFSLTDHFYGLLQFPEYRVNKTESDGSQPGFSNVFASNFNWLHNKKSTLTTDFPVRGFGAFGGKGWFAQIGREQLSWGPSESGNFLIDSHLLYHNMFRLSAYGKVMKYTFLTSFFSSPAEIKADDGLLGPIKMFMAHRFEWRIWDKVGIALTEGVMYQPQNNVLDLRILNPFGFYHNYYIINEANSIAQLELDYTPFSHWNFYGSWAVDEIRFLWTEKADSPTVHPDGMGFLLGTKCAYPESHGVWKGSFEWTYTTPYFYLRSVDPDKNQTGDYDNLNYVVASRRWVNGKLVYDQNYMGSPYGGDAIVFQLVGEYASHASWEAEARLLYVVHGEKARSGTSSYWKVGPDAYGEHTPTGGWNKAIRTAMLGLSGSKSWGNNWKVYGEMDVFHVANKNHEEGNTQWDVQWNVGFLFQISTPK